MMMITTRKSLKGALLAGGLLAAALGGGCGEDPCDQLLDVCNRCTESMTRQQCSYGVQADKGGENCEALLEYYVVVCP
jgi:hypothetical protein